MFKFGIIGSGKIARKFCDAVSLIEGAEVAAVASKTLDRAKALAEEKSIEAYFGDYEEMLKKSSLDAVYIATTHNFHYENALLCLEYNKPLLIEKPMVLSKKEAIEIFRLAREKNLFVMEAMWSRFLPHNKKAREWIANGAIGTLALVNCAWGFKPNPSIEGRYFSPDLAGGPLYDIGVYSIEVMTHLIGQPIREINTMMIPAHTGVDLTDNISIKFDTCIANLQVTYAAKVPMMALLYGTDGYIKIPGYVTGNECFLYDNEGNCIEHFKEQYVNGFTYEIAETIRCIREGLIESPVVPHADTVTCCEIFDRVLKNHL